MLKRYLIIGKSHLFLSASKADSSPEKYYIMDVLLTLETLWQAEDLLKKVSYFRSHSGTGAMNELSQLQNQLFKLLLPHVIFEKDREWLQKKVRD